jgi:hypothetical protein
VERYLKSGQNPQTIVVPFEEEEEEEEKRRRKRN